MLNILLKIVTTEVAAMPRKGPKRIEGSLDGLADAFDANKKLRRRALKTGSLLTWPCPEETGVMSLSNLALNCDCMEILIHKWAPQWTESLMVPVDPLKYEARH